MADPTEAKAAAECPARFEDLLHELEAIVKDLETGRLTLEESLERYQRGVTRLKRCYELLDAAEKKIEVLSRDDDGNIVFAPLDVASPEGARGRTGGGASRSAGRTEGSGESRPAKGENG
jgi:exodeoxyribonuclease VII small subunit